jgi:FxLD family lantipeptide
MSMAATSVVLDEPVVALTEEDFRLDMRVVELTTALVRGSCDTNDGCGSTCSTSACSTSSYDPV